MATENVLVTPFFKIVPVQNMKRSKEAGRPIFDDKEYVEVRIAGDRNYAPCFPATSMWKRVDGIEVTYAERWSEQYRKFKEGAVQVASGTPLSELPFLTESKRAELRALKIYTAEALAGLEGRNLKALGMEANTLKSQAKAYLDKATGSAAVVRQAEEISALRQQIEELKAAGLPAVAPKDENIIEATDFSTWEDELLKEHIAEKTGSRPRGNPSHDTLVAMATELEGAAA